MSKMRFAIDYYKVMHEDPYQMILEAYVVSEGDNVHETWFTKESLEKSIPYWANKAIVCMWDKYLEDFKEHARNKHQEEQQIFVGNIPETNMAEIVEYKGKQFLKMNVVIWKAYHPKIAQRLANEDYTDISMEIEPTKVSDRDDGSQQIDEFLPLGICLLGERYDPAIENATSKVIKYSTNDEFNSDAKKFNKYYSIAISEYNIPKEVKEVITETIGMEQKNSSIVKFSKMIMDSDKLTYAEITDLFGKINNTRKKENLLFYGGDIAREWCKNIILKFESDDITNFPEEGDNKKISLRNSNFETFSDYDYAKDLKENYPELWDDAGNVGEEWNGDKAFNYWTKHRKGEDTDNVLDWIKYREDSWMPRHEGNNQYKGSLAVMKWAGVTKDGVSKMKELINEKKSKIDDEKKKMSYALESDDVGSEEKMTIDNSKDFAIDSDSWDNPGKSLYEELARHSNYKALFNEAYLIVEDNFMDSPSSALKYPHHEIKDGKLAINIKGVQSAGSRLNQMKSSGDISEEEYNKALSHINKHRKELDMDELEKYAVQDVKTGDFVEWNSSGGKARGKVVKVVKDGEVDGIAVKVTGSKDDPAVKIQIYKQEEDGWVATDTYVGHKMSTVSIINDLKPPTEYGKEMYSLKLVDLFNLLAKMVEEKEMDDYGYPMYALENVDMDKGMMYVCSYGYPMKYYAMKYMPMEGMENMYNIKWDEMMEVFPMTEYVMMEAMKEEDMNMAKDMMGAMDKMYAVAVEKGKELKSTIEKYSDVDSRLSSKDDEINELKNFKFSAIKEKVQEKAEALYEKYSDFIDDAKKTEFNEKLEDVDVDSFEDKFAKEVYAYVLPLVEAKAEIAKGDSDEKQDEGLKMNYSSFLGNLTKGKESNSLVDRLNKL